MGNNSIFNSVECIDKWKLAELNELVSQIEDDMVEKTNDIKLGKNYSNIILRIMSSSIVRMREILCLCSCGYPDGAMSLARLLCEHAVILYFLETSESDDLTGIVANYHNNYEIQRLKTLKFVSEQIEHNQQRTQALQKELDVFTSNIADYKRRNKRDYWWANMSTFASMFDEVIKRSDKIDGPNLILPTLYVDYKLSCLKTHSSVLGNVWGIGKSKDITVIDTSATIQGHNLPLRMAVKAFAIITYISFTNLSLDYEKYKGALNDLLFFYDSKKSDFEK